MVVKNTHYKIAIIGSNGLLGSNLSRFYSNTHDIRTFSRKNDQNINPQLNHIIDFDNFEEALQHHFEYWRPEIIINCLGLVNLQICEDVTDEAMIVNVTYATLLAKLAKKYNSYYIHISTDHFFNDNKTLHNEEERITILNYYAKTKFLAEKEIENIYPHSLIVRTNIIGFRHTNRSSFFEWLLESLKNKQKITLYDNFVTSSIDIKSLSTILLLCFKNNLFGIYNIASKTPISKYDFGMQVAKKFGYNNVLIEKGNYSNEFVPVKRALTLGLDVQKIENVLNIKMPSTNDVLDTLLEQYKEYNNE